MKKQMYRLKLFFKYFVYQLTAKSKKGHGIHSPFVFKIVTAVLNDNKRFIEFERINKQRSLYLSSGREVFVNDSGAGSRVMKGSVKKLCDIAKYASTQQKYGELIFRLVRFFQPERIVEFGTSLGIGTFYLALAAPKGKVFTIEGSGKIADIAKKTLEQEKLKNAHVETGEFAMVIKSNRLPFKEVDFVYFDGGHTRETTLYLFDEMMTRINENSIFVFDDIRWSEEMEEAWKEIYSNPRVSLSIDLFKMGIVFFRKGISKQHVVLKY